MLFVDLMTFCLICLKLYDLPVNSEPAFMAELLKHFVACMDPFQSPNLIPSMENQTEEGGQPACFNNELNNSSITSGSFSYIGHICVALCCPLPGYKQLAWLWQSSHVMKEQLQNQKQTLFYWKLCTFVHFAHNFFPNWRNVFLESHLVFL